MNIEARKLEFIQEFLKLQSEETIARFEKILKKEKRVITDQPVEPMSQEEIDKRIDQSESDFKNNRFKSSEQLLSKYVE